MTVPSDCRPLQVSIINDHELVLRGLQSMLKPYEDRICIVELDSGVTTAQPVDVALYDTYAMGDLENKHLQETLHNPLVNRLVVYAWAVTPELLRTAEQLGVHGVLAKSLTGEQLVAALERVHAGEYVIHHGDGEAEDPTYEANGNWPGKAQGLTQRQSEVVALINKGLSNQEIARATYLSPNTVKSYIKAAYRTMGVSNRTQALLWSIDHGFDEDRSRVRPH